MPLQIHSLPLPQLDTTISHLTTSLTSIHDVSGQYLLHLPDGRSIDTKSWDKSWEWTHGIGLYALWTQHVLTNSSTSLNLIKAWFKRRFREGGTTKNVNTMCAMLTLANVYARYGECSDDAYRPWLESWSRWAMYDLPRTRYGGMAHMTYDLPNPDELWDDTLMMTVLPLIRIGLVLGRREYVEEGKRQFLVHFRYLFDVTTGLFFHGWRFGQSGEGREGHHFAGAKWARGNSWIVIVIPEVLELLDLPPDDPFRIHLLDTLSALCDALLRYQTTDGLWRTLIDVDPMGGRNYTESSATAGIAYGMLKALRLRYLVGEQYETCAVKAVKAVLGRINEEGELEGTSFGTAVGEDLEHYLNVPITTMPYGQALAIMALVEFKRLYI